MASLSIPAAGAPVPVLPSVSDDGLVALAARGSQRAFAELYRRHRGPLYGYCHAILRQHDDAQDAVQATMMRALLALERQEPPVSWRAWLFSVARNESVDQLRRRTQHGALRDAEAIAGPELEARVEQRARLEHALGDLEHLPERQRSALVLRELAGLSDVEIGAVLSMPPRGVRQAVFEARAALRAFALGRELPCEAVRAAIADGDGRRLRGRQVRAHLRACPRCRERRERVALPGAMALPLWLEDVLERLWPAKAIVATVTAGTIAFGVAEHGARLVPFGERLTAAPPVTAARPAPAPARRPLGMHPVPRALLTPAPAATIHRVAAALVHPGPAQHRRRARVHRGAAPRTPLAPVHQPSAPAVTRPSPAIPQRAPATAPESRPAPATAPDRPSRAPWRPARAATPSRRPAAPARPPQAAAPSHPIPASARPSAPAPVPVPAPQAADPGTSAGHPAHPASAGGRSGAAPAGPRSPAGGSHNHGGSK